MPPLSKVILLLLALLPRALAQAPPSIETSLASSMVVVGEQTRLTLIIRNAQVIDWPDAPNAAPLALTRAGKNRIYSNGRILEVYEYSVTAFQEGLFTVPAFQLRTSQGIISSRPLSLRASPVSSLATKGISIKPDTVPYLSGIFVEKNAPYIGETQKLEAKLYLPNSQPYLMQLYDGNVIQMEKDGIAAWRLTAARRPSGILNYDGLSFQVYTYKSSFNALREGELFIGPGKASPLFELREIDRGRFRIRRKSFPIEFPAASLNVKALPEGAPQGFAGAVGNFSLEIFTKTRDLKLGDSMTVEAKLTGSGNIDQFPGPFLVDPENHWKQFEMISKPPGSERRSSSGTVEFSQIIRPMSKLPALPPYRFIFFDPVLQKYRILNSPAQPITITGVMPTDEAQDTNLAFLSPSSGGLKSFSDEASSRPTWLWQIIPATLLLFIVISALQKRLNQAKQDSLPAREFKAALEQLKAKSENQIEFYREAATFIETWKGTSGFEDIIETRDAICFRPDTPTEPVPHIDKNRILKRLQTLSPLLLVGFFFVFALQPAQALDQDPEKARLEILQEMERQAAPEHFYNMALCEKALERPAKASLWAYRYQAQGRDASELHKGLPGIRMIKREGTDWVTLLPLSLYRQMTIAGVWAFTILIAAIIFRSLKARRLIITLCSIIAPITLIIGGGAWSLYPNEMSFQPLQQLSVISYEESPLQSQPYAGGNMIRENVAGSLCKILAERGEWLKLELPGGIKGWTQTAFVEPIRMDSN